MSAMAMHPSDSWSASGKKLSATDTKAERSASDAVPSDSWNVTGQKLSATGTNTERVAALEETRSVAGVSQAVLSLQANISDRTYRTIVASPAHAKPAVLGRLERALDRLTRAPKFEALEAELIASTYRGFVAVLAPDLGVSVADVDAADPRSGATADPHWRACAHVRQAAIYLTNTSLGVRQRRLAEVLGLTPAAVCLALQSVEDRRDDPELSEALRRAARIITGRDEE